MKQFVILFAASEPFYFHAKHKRSAEFFAELIAPDYLIVIPV